MTGTDLGKEKHCIVFGGLDGAGFVSALTILHSDLSRLGTFVADLSDAANVAPSPMVSIGYEVDRDAVVIHHLDESLHEAITRLIDLRVMTRTARVALQKAGLAAT